MGDQKFWIHKDGWIYVGDKTEGAREATQEEIDEHMKKTYPDEESEE